MGRISVGFTDAQESDVIRRYLDGENARSISESFGCSTGPVIKILKRHSVYSPKGTTGPLRRFSVDQIADMVGRYTGGEGATAISTDYGCTKDTVQRVLKNSGVYEGRKRLRAFDADQEQEVIRRYKEGESARSIGLSFGLTRVPVENVLKSRGLYQPRDFAGFTPEQEADMVDRYQGGATAEDIRRDYGCGRGPVVTVLKRHGVYRPYRPQGLTAEDRDRAVLLYQEGAKPSEIARGFGCDQSTVDKVLKARGVWVSPTSLERIGSRFTMDQKREMVARYESGDSIYKIAMEFDGVPQSIWKILNAAGVEFRDKAWRGGRVAASGGYTAIAADPEDPIASAMANVTGYVLEHRLILAQSLARPLAKHETVHHINGDRRDNRLENLQLRNGNHGKGVRLSCLDCGSHNVSAVPLAP